MQLKFPAYLAAALVVVPVCMPAPASAQASSSKTPILAQVTVTAEKETQNLQRTAADITALSANTMINAGVTSLRQAQMIVPAVRFQAEGNNTQVFMRGVGANLDDPNIEPNIAFIFAGSYMPREATSAAFFDIAQLQVLPGSQGTLYGHSAIGGIIALTPVKPGFNDDGNLLLEVGNYSSVHVTEAQNLKISDSVAARAAVDYAYNRGFETSGADSKNDLSGRISLLIRPNNKLSVYLYGQAATKRGFGENLVNKGLNPVTGKYCETCFLYANAWNDTRTGKFAEPFGTTAAERNHYKLDMVGGQVNYRFDGLQLTYIPSYLYLDSRPLYWLSAIESTNSAHYNQFEQELRLTNLDRAHWNWLAGLSYYNSRDSGSEYLFPNLPFRFYQSNVLADRLEAYAAFGQVTYSVTPSLRLTVGGRESSTKRTAYGLEVVALGGAPYYFQKTYRHFDWKAGIEKDLSPSVMLYAVVQTGFQAGTFNQLPNTKTYSNAVSPEELKSYTAGIKSRWFDQRLQINDEAYFYDFHNLIIQAYNISAPYNQIFNGDKITVKGDQLDILARVFSRDEANLNVSYSRARNVNVSDPTGKSYNGLAPAYAPDWVILAGYTHVIPIGDAELRAHVNWRYESRWWADYVHNRGTEQVPDNKFDATLTYQAGNWSVGFWIKNITNTAVIAATAAAGIPGPATAYLEDPRTFGIRATLDY